MVGECTLKYSNGVRILAGFRITRWVRRLQRFDYQGHSLINKEEHEGFPFVTAQQ